MQPVGSLILEHVIEKLPGLNLYGKVTFDPVATEKGGTADVHKGLLESDAEQEAIVVAVKRLRYKVDDEKGFAREIRYWSDFEHKNILKFEGYFIEGEFPALVSRWMKDGSLWTYILAHKKNSSLDRKQAMILVSDISRGLAYMHEKGAIHSDMKSDNVLISPDKRALLTDFGISRMDTHTRGYTMTNPGGGSIRWHAAELLNFQNGTAPSQSSKTDVWAFGMTVYEILSYGRPYAEMGNDIQVAMQILNGTSPPKPVFSKIARDEGIEQFMWSVCEDCRTRDPQQRPTMAVLEATIEKKLPEFGINI
ncbi:kinase-like protein [Schizopora paradoxa]|uniref:Kinase-like protein n=1 Tax=Schizopora paradoxa TaxID=27342 RepID=A0A0H2RD22_9AGAM|nr:kinase-like protein [Schizopora paradoxa]